MSERASNYRNELPNINIRPKPPIPTEIKIEVGPREKSLAPKYYGRDLASFRKRFFGFLLDKAIENWLAAPIATIVYIDSEVNDASSEALQGVLGLFVIALLIWRVAITIVNWVMIAERGQSIAKRMLRMKIVNVYGRPPGFLQGVVIRNWIPAVLNYFTCVFFPIDACMIFAGREQRCIHDMIANTRVINAPPPKR